MRLGLALLAVALGLVTAGCGAIQHLSATSGNAATGKTLFKANCGTCHTLKDAGTTATVGPDLDASFGPTRACHGFKNVESTIRDIVRGQIAYADSSPGQLPAYKGASTTGMPANIVRGQDAKDVAVYVASVAGANWNCDTAAAG